MGRFPVLGIISLTALVLAGCEDPEDELPTTESICSDRQDNDDDGDIDCDDSDCNDDPACAFESDCTDGDDGDGDGAVDCDDSDCNDDPACDVASCGDGTCGDEEDASSCAVDCPADCGDALCTHDEDAASCESDCPADCGDDACTHDEDAGACPADCPADCGDGLCTHSEDSSTCALDCPELVEICDNEIDDDLDGLIDCADLEDCEGDPACLPPEEICDNEVDDDLDGLIDCTDLEDCEGDPACLPPEEICDNEIDDDGDELTDCADLEDCEGDPACAELCDNEVDDDGDGLIDCRDPDCDASPACAELCNGEDDDGDGLVDENPTDPELGEACYDGPEGMAGVGQCEQGTVECFGGMLLCLGWVAPLEEELCDGIDNDCDGTAPDDEIARGCSTTVVAGEVSLVEFQTEVRDVDVHVNLDTTGSMGGALETLQTTLSTTIVPGIRDLLPTSEFGFSTFDDFPLGGFGDALDLPIELHQRVTSNVPAVQRALESVGLHNGNDGPESGVESLYQIATGAGTSWPLDPGSEDCPPAIAGRASVTTALVDPVGDWDAYSISLADGQTLVAQVFASTAASSLDPYLYLHDQTDGALLTSNDDWCGLDSRLSYVAEGDQDLVLVARGYGDSSTGWYALSLTVDDVAQVGDGETCAGLEVGSDPFAAGVFDPALAVPMVEASTVLPRADAPACQADCEALSIDADWAMDFCEGVIVSGVCGDGALDSGEACDDGNNDDGDGCSAGCLLESVVLPPFDWTAGYDPGLGHGSLGGVGFRATALPVIVHITDAVSHDCADYSAYDPDIDAHCATDTFDALGALGARVVAVATYTGSEASLLDPLGMVTATDSLVPLCAFDGAEARADGRCAADQCCTGIDGSGEAPNLDGECPLVFRMDSSGLGLDTSIVNSIDALTQFIRYELTVAPRDDPTDAVDALCFVDAIGITEFVGPSGSCAIDPTPFDSDGDGVDDTLIDATPRTRVTFEISAVNEDIHDIDGDGDTTEACAAAGVYGLFIDVLAEGGTVVATRRVEVEVR